MLYIRNDAAQTPSAREGARPVGDRHDTSRAPASGMPDTMRPNHLRSVARPPDEESSPGLEPRPAAPAGPASDPALESALARCERGEAAGTDELRAWQNGRLHGMLARMLVNPELTARALDRLLADVAQTAGTRRDSGDGAEDWLFARLRRHGREVEREAGVEPRLRAVAAAAVPAVPTPAAIEIPPAPPPPYADPGPGTLNPRLRRHRAPVHAPAIEEIPTPAGAPRRWPLLIGLGLVAASAAGGLVLLAPSWLAETRDFAPPAPSVVTAPLPLPVSAPPAASPRDLLGDPIADREPPRVAVPPDQGPDPAHGPTIAPAIFAPLRIFVHHGAADPDGATLARGLAADLRAAGAGYVEVKSVPFTVVTTSVRYFRPDDRPATEQVTAAIRPVLTAKGRAAPSTPIDFTDFRPLPRPGTIEIWVPAR